MFLSAVVSGVHGGWGWYRPIKRVSPQCLSFFVLSFFSRETAHGVVLVKAPSRCQLSLSHTHTLALPAHPPLTRTSPSTTSRPPPPPPHAHALCLQRSLQLVAAIAVPTLMILGLSLLYGRSDPAEWCGWCENISCVEFPPGDNPWWACDECSTVGFTVSHPLLKIGNRKW